ncbi:eukaryotic translation initiation factor [Cyclospora cayetanensis]|uniref:Translation initiation factor eIF2B subunit beta n=1 Tax=Cyclospora cayetanensis TaxID=88456 RepID=A0A1D3CT51_9EIME|nr:eukaryotic translation initiation factor [Cyclospora cayetanensis]
MSAKRTAEASADCMRQSCDCCTGRRLHVPWTTTQELVDVVTGIGRRLICAAPLDLLVANVVRRVLCIFRTEHYKHQDAHRQSLKPTGTLWGAGYTGGEGEGRYKGSERQLAVRGLRQQQPQQRAKWVAERAAPSMASYFDPYAAVDARDFLLPVPPTVKQSIFESMSELLAEIDSLWEDGEEIRMSCFHDGDCILTYGYSLAVERLLIAVHEKNQKLQQAARRSSSSSSSRCCFEVVVLGGDAEDGGKRLAANLKKANIQTTYIPDTALFPVISKVDKVLLGTVAVLSSGGVVTVGGANSVAQAAKFFSKPLIAVAPLFKLTYLPFFDHHSSNELLPPAAMVPEGLKMGNVSIRIPMFDYVPRSLVSVFITDVGAIDPSYLFTLSRQRYHVDDIALSIVD